MNIELEKLSSIINPKRSLRDMLENNSIRMAFLDLLAINGDIKKVAKENIKSALDNIEKIRSIPRRNQVSSISENYHHHFFSLLESFI